MIDPVTLGITALAAGGSALAAGSMKTATPSLPTPPPGLQPATQPNPKPQQKSLQSTFLSGAAMAQQAQGPRAPGKTLIGA